jgi:hypothetical protein
MERRKFVLGVGALAAGGAAAVGSGAFTSVSANRDVTIDVADDSDALLGIDGSNASNGDYLIEGGQNVAALDITDSNGNIVGSGVNENSTTVLRDLFDIKNQGANGVFVFINTGVEKFGFFSDFPANVENGKGLPEPTAGPGGPTTNLALSGSVTNTDGLPGNDNYDFTEGVQASIPARVYLEPGQALREVGTVINTAGGFGSDAPIDTTATVGAVSVDALADSVSVDTSVGKDYEVEVTGFTG